MATKGIATVKGQDDWQTESDLRILIEADCIRKDKKRLTKAQALAKEKMMEVAAVASEGDDK